MQRLLKENKIFHFRIERRCFIPTKALEAYVSSGGEATWAEQQELLSQYEVRLPSDKEIASLPIHTPYNAIKQIKCPPCGTECWHDEISEEMVRDFDYKAYCYRCAAKMN